MKTTIYGSDQLEQGLSLAVEKLRHDEVVAFPTETVYGLGARIFSPSAIQKIYQAKGRPSDNPLIAHISNMDQVKMIAKDLPKTFEILSAAFFPGPLTLIVPKHPNVPDEASADLPTIGVRMPNHPLALALIEHTGEPIVAPSANLSGKPSPTQAKHVLKDLDGKIEIILDGGPCQIGIESTILDLTTPTPTILRPGAITKNEIEEVLGSEIHQSTHVDDNATPKAPGMKYRHYAPVAKVVIMENWSDANIQEVIELKDTSVVLSDSELPEKLKNVARVWSLTTASLYSAFRQADEDQLTHIFLALSSNLQQNTGLFDRILKASQE